MKKSLLAPRSFPSFPFLEGLKFNAITCGIKNNKKLDLMLVVMEKGTSCASLVTNSYTAAAPIKWIKQIRKHGVAKALIVNSGNANAFTGSNGFNNVKLIVKNLSSTLNCNPKEIYIASTGVIGEQLPINKILKSLPILVNSLSEDPKNWKNIADAICTTDTFSKGSIINSEISGKKIKIIGIAKGSGMIAPNMATMLAFIYTDASINSEILHEILKSVVEETFNSITVDSDTSTSDAVCIFATNKIKFSDEIKSAKDPLLVNFIVSLKKLCLDLAKQIVSDGEGANKLIEIKVSGSLSNKKAKTIAMSIANSLLVKTAIAGEDANWGRIIMAIGKSGVKTIQKNISIKIGGINITRNGSVEAGYNEEPVTKHLKGKEILLDIKVGIGKGTAKVWTCDLTKEYIDINAGYRS